MDNTIEILNNSVSFNMNRPVVWHPQRGLNYKFMVAEASYILQGRNDINFLARQLPKFGKYSDDGHWHSGAYGPKFVDQVPYILDTLASDEQSRRAVLTIWNRSPRKSVDTPCTVAMQFIVRRDRLHTIVTMRSSDAFTGLAYDMFCFSIMSACIAHERGLDLGMCYINAGSSHIYTRDCQKANSIIFDDFSPDAGPEITSDPREYFVDRFGDLLTMDAPYQNMLEHGI